MFFVESENLDWFKQKEINADRMMARKVSGTDVGGSDSDSSDDSGSGSDEEGTPTQEGTTAAAALVRKYSRGPAPPPPLLE